MSSTLPSLTERLHRSAAGPVVRTWVSRARDRRRRPHASAPLPPHRKVETVAGYVARFGPSTFVETGTFRGDTVAAIAPLVVDAVTIELDPTLAALARTRFAEAPNVTVLEGDSAQLLPSVVAELALPALFWLDGHYSAGPTAGEGACPILAELSAVLTSRVDHVVLIDDARLFDGTDHYPTIAEVRQLVDSLRPDLVWRIADDIIRLHPGRRPTDRRRRGSTGRRRAADRRVGSRRVSPTTGR